MSAVLHDTLARVLAELERLDPTSLIAARGRGVLEASAPVPPQASVSKGGRKAGWRKKAGPEDYKIAGLYEQGLTSTEIANQTGKCSGSIRAALARCGVEMRKPGTRLSPTKPTQAALDRLERIKLARAEGKTLEEIGQSEGVTRERIRQICVKAGIATPKPELTDAERAAAQRYLDGDSLDTAGASIGVSKFAMRSIVARCGFPIRPSKRGKKVMPATIAKAERAGEMYAAGRSTKDIAAELGLQAVPQVYRFLALAGVKPGRHRRDSLKLTPRPGASA